MTKLRFKGERENPKKRILSEEPKSSTEQCEATWIKATDVAQLRGPLFIVFTCLEQSLTFCCEEDSPRVCCKPSTSNAEPERIDQVLVAYPFESARYFGLKTAFGKYLRASTGQQLEAANEAIGTREQWEFEKKDSGYFVLKSQHLQKYFVINSTEPEQDMQQAFGKALQRKPGDFNAENGWKCIFTTEKSEATHLDIFIQSKLKAGAESKMEAIEKYKHLNVWNSEHEVAKFTDKDLLAMGKKEPVKVHEAMLEKRAKLKSDKYCK